MTRVLGKVVGFITRSYLCGTCGLRVPKDVTHEHGCPLEGGEPCGSRMCNEQGQCCGD